METLAKVILFVLCFVQSSYSLCTYVNGSTQPQVCSLHSAVSKKGLRDNKFILVNYEVNLETKDCSLLPDVKAKATIDKGSAALSVTATNSKAKVISNVLSHTVHVQCNFKKYFAIICHKTTNIL